MHTQYHRALDCGPGLGGLNTFWSDFVCQLALLNFPIIMQALKKQSIYNFATKKQKCTILLQMCQEDIYYFERNITVVFKQSIFHSVFWSSPPFSNTSTCVVNVLCNINVKVSKDIAQIWK